MGKGGGGGGNINNHVIITNIHREAGSHALLKAEPFHDKSSPSWETYLYVKYYSFDRVAQCP